MITPEYLEQCPDRLVELYEQAERDIIADIARKISEYDFFVSSAEWQANKAKEMGMTHDEILKRLSQATGQTKTEIVKLLKESGVKLSDAKLTQANINTLNAGLRRTLGTFDNLTKTTAINGTRQISEALERAYMQVTSGAFSQETAIKNAIVDLTRNGIETYRYPHHTDYIDVVVRRAVRTGVNQTAAEISLSNAEELKTDLVEVTAHDGARPTHAEWQGKVYSISGNNKNYKKLSEATGYGSVTGLCGANCRHSFHPFIEGSDRMYTDKELKAMNEPVYEYNGQSMTEYEATQRQRYIERQLRRWKREKAGMEAAGLPAERAISKIKQWRNTQEDFLQQTGLKRQYGREEIPKSIAKPAKSSIIKMQKSLGAAAKNYQVKLLDGNDHTKLAENQKIDGKTFAGRGTNVEIRDRFRLESNYHIPADEWEKVSGKGYVILDGKRVLAELHWYEADGEIYEMKVKRYLDESQVYK